MAPYTEQERAQQSDAERAQLWAVYFGLRAVESPTPTLAAATRELHDYLNPPQKKAEAHHLSLVGGEG